MALGHLKEVGGRVDGGGGEREVGEGKEWEEREKKLWLVCKVN